jgi:hypothetical protein
MLRVNKTDIGRAYAESGLTLTAQKKSDQLFMSAPAHGGTTALGENILILLKWIEVRRRHTCLGFCALRAVSRN